MKNTFFALFFSFSALAAFAPANGFRRRHKDHRNSTIELKTDETTLLIPKKLVKKKLKAGEKADITLTMDELQQIKTKK